MLKTTNAIILSKIKHSDSSYIVKTFTEIFGLKSFYISVANNRASKQKRILLNPLSVVEIAFNHSEKQQLERIKEIKQFIAFRSIPFDIEKSTITLFLSEFLVKILKEESENKPLFNFIVKAINVLDNKELNTSQFHLNFLICLTTLLGIAPKTTTENNYLNIDEGVFETTKSLKNNYLNKIESTYFLIVLGTIFDGDSPQRLNKNEKSSLLNNVLLFYQTHLNINIEFKSIPVLQEVFS